MMNAEQVQGTNDSSIVSKLSMVERGYFEDSFIKYFVEKPSRRSPLINRCYYARAAAVSYSVEKFITENPGKKQIISLGAGFDTTYFRLKAKRFVDDLNFVEVDYPDVMKRKILLAKKAKLISIDDDDLSQFRTERELDMLIHKSINYSCIGYDLQAVGNKFHSLLETIGVDFQIPTLFLSEVVLTYLPSKSSSDVLHWVSETFPNTLFVIFEQVTPNDGFGKVMCKHFKQIGSPLLTINDYPTIASHVRRHKSHGFAYCSATSLDRFYYRCLPMDRRKMIESLEIFDEFEAWHRACQHYFILCSTNSKEVDLQDFCQSLFKNKQQIRDLEIHLPNLKTINLKNSTNRTVGVHRYGHSMSVIQTNDGNQYAVIIGGFGTCNDNRAHQRLTDNVVVLDLETLETYPCKSCDETLPKSLRYPMFASSVSSHFNSTTIYHFGGRASPMKSSNNLMRMTFLSDGQKNSPVWTCKFTEVQSGFTQTLPDPRWRHSAVMLRMDDIHEYMILFGGRNAHTILDDFWSFNVKNETWNKMAVTGVTILPRHSHSMCVLDENSVLISGGLGQSEVTFDDVFQIDNLDSNCTSAIAARLVFSNGFISPFYSHTSHCKNGYFFLVGGVKSNEHSLFGDAHPSENYKIDVLDIKSRTLLNSVSVSGSASSPMLLHNHTSALSKKLHQLVLIGGGDNCFSFGTWFNEASLPIDLELLFDN